ARTAEHRHLAGPHDLADADRLQQLDQRVDLVLGAGQLHDVGAARDVDDLAAEDVDDVHHFTAGPLVGIHLDEYVLALEVLRAREVGELDDRDQLVELLLDLLEHLVVAARDERDPGHAWVHRLGDGQALDVEAASAEKPGDSGEDAELV